MHQQGPLEQTNRNLDIAVEGEGFFRLQMPDGSTTYTRDGSFQISDQGLLVASSGQALQPPIRVPADAAELTISTSGIVSVRRGQEIQPTEIGRIELARFANPSGLIALGQNLYAPTAASGQPVVGFPSDDGMGRTQQGSLEGSNVEIVQEMVEMISAMRAYEINSKAIKTADEMGQIANNITR
jgi:flagellar basal-body rod protein FlgG